MSKLVGLQFLGRGSTLRRQACDIIDSILDDPSPELDDVKRRLYRCLADHPHVPEAALLAHLLETSHIANADSGDWPDSAGRPEDPPLT